MPSRANGAKPDTKRAKKVVKGAGGRFRKLRDARDLTQEDVREKTGTYTSHSEQEVRQWQRDYAGREVVWSDVAGLVGKVSESIETLYSCSHCGGYLIAQTILRDRQRRRANLEMKCVYCGKKRVFYSVPKR